MRWAVLEWTVADAVGDSEGVAVRHVLVVRPDAVVEVEVEAGLTVEVGFRVWHLCRLVVGVCACCPALHETVRA